MRVEKDKFVIEWVIPERVIQITYLDVIKHEHLADIAQNLEPFYEVGVAPLHVISDHTNMESVDADLKTLKETFDMFTRNKWDWIIIVGTNRLLNFFAALLEKVFNLGIRHADSPEEALESLRRLDQSLSEDAIE